MIFPITVLDNISLTMQFNVKCNFISIYNSSEICRWHLIISLGVPGSALVNVFVVWNWWGQTNLWNASNAHFSFFKPCCKGKLEVNKDTYKAHLIQAPAHFLVLTVSSTAAHLNKVPIMLILLLLYFSGDCNFPVQLLSVSIRKYNQSVILSKKISLILLRQYLRAGNVRYWGVHFTSLFRSIYTNLEISS